MSTSTPLQPVILESGINAIWRAANDGVDAKITHIALGDAGYKPDQKQSALRSERVRYPIAGGEKVSPHQIHLVAIADGLIEFWVKEVGFVLADGSILAIWSDPTKVLAYKSDGIDLLLAYDINLSALPADSVTVISSGAGLNLNMAWEYITMAILI